MVCGLLCERFAGEGKLGGCDVELQVGFGDIRYGECEVYEVLGWVGCARALGPEDCDSVNTTHEAQKRFHVPSGWTVAADMMIDRSDVAKEWMRGMEV